jgi:hypothetical protein
MRVALLARSVQDASAACSTFLSLFGGGSQVGNGTLEVGRGVSLEILHDAALSSSFNWGDKRLHFIGVGFGSDTAPLVAHLRGAASVRGTVSSVLGGLGFSGNRFGQPLPQPQLVASLEGGGEGGSHAPGPPPPPAFPAAAPEPPAAALLLKEVVLGVGDGAALQAQQGRASHVARRNRAALSVWTAPCGINLRLLPSAYSALVFWGACGEAGDLEALGERLRTSGGGAVELYGQRSGAVDSASNGQLRFSHPTLHGLDVRFCAAGRTPAFFNEARETLTDRMDPALNDMQSKSVSLACKSIVGMDMVSTLRLRAFGRVG